MARIVCTSNNKRNQVKRSRIIYNKTSIQHTEARTPALHWELGYTLYEISVAIIPSKFVMLADFIKILDFETHSASLSIL